MGKKQDYFVGVDLGGTKLLAVVFDEAYTPSGGQRKKSGNPETTKQFSRRWSR